MGRVKASEDHSKKKTTLYAERCAQKRQEYLHEIENYSRQQLVYVDESGIDSYLHKPFGRAKRGTLVKGDISGKRFARESFVAAKCGSKILAPFCFKGTCNTALFNLWIEKFLVPELHPGQVVVLDNATFHKSTKTKQLIEKAGCRLVFLPPYSPDLNPIEVFWANLKAKIRTFLDKSSTLAQIIDRAFMCKIPD